MSTKKQKLSFAKQKVRKYEKLYNETKDTKYQDLAIKARREVLSLSGGANLSSNNIYLDNHTTYYNKTGSGLTGQKS